MSNKFVIVSDSTTDLPVELANEIELVVIPLSVHIGDKTYVNYLDEREIKTKDFYDQVMNGALPTTSQVNPTDYEDTLKPILDAGNDVLILSFSSALSGTYNSGRIAVETLKAEYPDRKIEIIDTKSASLGEGLLVYLAGLERKQGKTFEEVHQFVLDTYMHIGHWFTVNDINHLRRGGRISAMSSVVANLLNIKPVMHANEEGKLVARSKAVGRKKAIRSLVDQVKETALDVEQTVFIGHGDDLESAEMLKTEVEKVLNIKKLVIHYIGPVIGAHTGQGVLAVFFLAKHR
jgi:DegV family protein with EDD domain